jgi:hypothetical protein
MIASATYYTGALGVDVRCEGITAAGEQCRCRAVMEVNQIPYCKQHGNKELRAIAMLKPTNEVRP